jgi:mono/diheme cytochrome c family protein
MNAQVWNQLLALVLVATSPVFGAGGPPLLKQPPTKETDRVNPYEKLDKLEQERAVKAGQKIFKLECSACHGESARGTRIAPALVSPTLNQTTPGAVFWILRNGSLRHGMPSFAHLPDQQRWQIVTYLRTL